jgi:hypothetical protein
MIRACQAVTVAQAEAGELEGAVHTAATLQGTGGRIVVQAIAAVLAKQSSAAAALAFAIAQVPCHPAPPEGQAPLLQLRDAAKREDPIGALALMAPLVAGKPLPLRVLSAVARAQLAGGDLPGAIQTARAADDRQEGYRILSGRGPPHSHGDAARVLDEPAGSCGDENVATPGGQLAVDDSPRYGRHPRPHGKHRRGAASV